LLAAIAAGQRANLSPSLVREIRARYEISRAGGRPVAAACGETLGAEELAAIGREMATRRAALR
jgi:hypothetical protein